MSSIAYRSDIDGLRALAVLLVVAFHLGIEPFEGGFIGVDVFFVISGYLITSILEQQMSTSSFSFGNFYLRRARRLLPALFATIFLSFSVAALQMTSDDLIRCALSAVSALVAASSFVFLAEAGYWDTASELKPLLHTWSLGVEEQFYFIWPSLMLLIRRSFESHRIWLVLLVMTCAGLALSEFETRADPSTAFYLLPFRVFEFSFGALVIYAGRSNYWRRLASYGNARDAVFLAGFVAIVSAALSFDGGTPFPGINAFWPGAGAGLILIAGAGDVGAGRLGRAVLANPVSLWLGRVSYSMYLVHWPIVALYRYRFGSELDFLEQAGLGIGILFATAFLHYGVERRFRMRASSIERTSPTRITPKAFALTTLSSGVVISLIAGHAFINEGWTWRFPDIALTPEQIEHGKQNRFRNLGSACRIDQYSTSQNCQRTRPVKVLLLGNSHEVDGFNFFNAGYGDDGRTLLIYFGELGVCSDLQFAGEQWRTSNRDCVARAKMLTNTEFLSELDILVYSSNKPFASNKSKFSGVIRFMKRRNPRLKVITMGGYINTTLPCARIINEHGSDKACARSEFVSYFENEPASEPLYDEVMAVTDHLIDKVDLLCSGRSLATCITSTSEGVPMSYDEHHLSLEFAEMAGRRYAESHRDLLRDLADCDRYCEAESGRLGN